MSTTIIVNDKMQHGYRYVLSAPEGRNFDPSFMPDLTPQEMLRLGVFGGIYLRDCTKEFPASWFARARFATGDTPDPAQNHFRVLASQPLSEWRRKGWVHPDDPRGWFQWYCRYYRGRRHPDDARQIRRFRAMVRHVAQVKRHCEAGDIHCRPVQRQALLQWGYDSRSF